MLRNYTRYPLVPVHKVVLGYLVLSSSYICAMDHPPSASSHYQQFPDSVAVTIGPTKQPTMRASKSCESFLQVESNGFDSPQVKSIRNAPQRNTRRCAQCTCVIRGLVVMLLGVSLFYLGKLSGTCEQLVPLGEQLTSNTGRLDTLAQNIKDDVAKVGVVAENILAQCAKFNKTIQ